MTDAMARIMRIARSSLGSLDLHYLEAPGQRRVFLDVLLVLGPGGCRDGSQRAARKCRLEQIRGVASAGSTAGADQRVRLVDEHDDRLLGGLNFLDDLFEPLFEFTLHTCAGLQQADIQRAQRHVLQ